MLRLALEANQLCTTFERRCPQWTIDGERNLWVLKVSMFVLLRRLSYQLLLMIVSARYVEIVVTVEVAPTQKIGSNWEFFDVYLLNLYH